MSSILILNGPNLKHLGQRDPDTYGTESMDTVREEVAKIKGAPDLVLFQSNHEGAIIDRLEEARVEYLQGSLLGIALNAGAFTHTSLALADCLSWIHVPFIEVHISNILARSDGTAKRRTDVLRGQSLFASSSLGLISGFGVESYVLAVMALMRYKNKI